MDDSILRLCRHCGNRSRPRGKWRCPACSDAKSAANFWSKVDMAGDCWAWLGYRDADGYGRILYRGGVVPAHRVSWAISSGTMPESSVLVCHHCDNPSCVRPSHLFLGTPADNSGDMASKGRSTRGSRNPRAKLSEQSVVEIRKLAEVGASRASLAREFGVTESVIHNVVFRATWKHVP